MMPLCASAFADNKADAKRTLEHAVTEIADTLNKADLTTVTEDSELIINLEQMLLNIFSMEQFSMRTIGKKWKNFSPEQKTAFKNSFVQLLKTTYFNHVKEYEGNRIQFVGERTNKKGTKVEILTRVDFNGKTLPVSYRMIQENDKWMVYDILVEGVSMVKSYRTQFSEILRKGSADVLISKLEEKAEHIRNQRVSAN